MRTLMVSCAAALLAVFAAAGSTATAAPPAAPATDVPAGSAAILGRWRVSLAMRAPWLGQDAPAPDTTSLLGREVEFHADRVDGPAALSCRDARYAVDLRPRAGLFQGAELDAAAAARVGLTAAAIRSVSLGCDTGVFDLHFVNANALLLGLDNAVWVLDRSPGALADEGTPEAALQGFLEEHFRHGQGFDAECTAAHRWRFSHRLQGAIAAYEAREFPPDEVPTVNGDPYSDSQEYPLVFSVGRASIEGSHAHATVDFDDGYRTRHMRYRLVREDDAWRIDDIDYALHDGSGDTFTALMQR